MDFFPMFAGKYYRLKLLEVNKFNVEYKSNLLRLDLRINM